VSRRSGLSHYVSVIRNPVQSMPCGCCDPGGKVVLGPPSPMVLSPEHNAPSPRTMSVGCHDADPPGQVGRIGFWLVSSGVVRTTASGSSMVETLIANCYFQLPLVIIAQQAETVRISSSELAEYLSLPSDGASLTRTETRIGWCFSLAAAIILEIFHCNKEVVPPIRRDEHGQIPPAYLCTYVAYRLLASRGQWRRPTMVGWAGMTPGRPRFCPTPSPGSVPDRTAEGQSFFRILFDKIQMNDVPTYAIRSYFWFFPQLRDQMDERSNAWD
jgi:hypothetical protein